jgi:hypothetical protein
MTWTWVLPLPVDYYLFWYTECYEIDVVLLKFNLWHEMILGGDDADMFMLVPVPLSTVCSVYRWLFTCINIDWSGFNASMHLIFFDFGCKAFPLGWGLGWSMYISLYTPCQSNAYDFGRQYQCLWVTELRQYPLRCYYSDPNYPQLERQCNQLSMEWSLYIPLRCCKQTYDQALYIYLYIYAYIYLLDLMGNLFG